ncbi:FAD-binding oxidoreductase [Alicyclobacillus pomorum]|uniref:FAD-binding oxidoreductase n=1 Tax=Alicyclobacillus pomorum TaxID=204470 RepID=UPI0003FD6FD1|nr:FAD-binding oxidoreductase [Alicyclobacillus pomorum]
MGRVESKVSPQIVAEAAAAVIGRDCVRIVKRNAEHFASDGFQVVVEPDNELQVSEVMRLAQQERWTVCPIGAGTQLSAGSPEDVDIILAMGKMNRILAYSPEDMVVTVQPGVSLNTLQAVLREHQQMLPLDPILADEATIGGVVATGASGPRRVLYGTVRDMVIGLRTVYPGGEVVRTGAKVVKNVAGYDMTKLFTGSFGTLGVLTEVTFKLRPLPIHRETVVLSGSASAMDHLRKKVVDSYLIPSRFEVTSGGWQQVAGESHGNWNMSVDCDENESSAADQTAQLKQWADELGLTCTVFRKDSADEWWDVYHRQLLEAETVVRIGAPPSTLTAIGASVFSDVSVDAYRLSLGVGHGVGRLYLRGLTADKVVHIVEAVRKQAVECGGHAVVEKAPLSVRNKVDSFGATGSVEGLLRGIKASIDPQGILNPGRFVGGI